MIECVRCGADLGNGGIDKAVHIVDVHPDDPTRVETLYLGRECGCDKRVLTKAALRHYWETYQPPPAPPEPEPEPEPELPEGMPTSMQADTPAEIRSAKRRREGARE